MASALRDRCILIVALTLPTFITLLYFVWLSESAALLYGPLKGLQFGLPLLWVYGIKRQRAQEEPLPRGAYQRSLALGIAFGLAVGGIMIVAALLWLAPSGFFNASLPTMKDKVAALQLASPALFIGLGVFYALVHSLLEEYYWRWFVFRECRAQLALPAAITLSSAGFMLHHIFVLAEYFGWGDPVTYLFSLSVAIGGAFWAWLYHRCGTLLGPWISHLLIDAAIFAVGYQLLF